MPQQELLKRVVQTLDALGIDYMLTGSVASSLQGEPRSSHDIDVVVHLRPASIPQLLQAFPDPEFYLDGHSIHEAVRRRSMFNLLQISEGEKVDFWLLTDDAFDQTRFARKRVETFLGMRVNVSAPEDTILKKLSWSKDLGGSEKQMTDALRVFEVQRAVMDLDYINEWAAKLGVQNEFQQLLQAAKPIPPVE